MTSSHIVGDEGLAELKRSLTELPPDEVKSLLAAMATNPSMLAEDSLAELASLLGQRSPEIREVPKSVVQRRAIAENERDGT